LNLRPLFVVISGRNKDKLSPGDAFLEYMQRYGIESFFRFGKQTLWLDKFQTPDVQHLDNWILVLQLTVFLLFLTAFDAPHSCPKWQKYVPIEKEPSKVRLTIAQARKSAEVLFLTFAKSPFLPIKSQKGKPRKKGQIQLKRSRYEIVKKKKKPPV
jgi:hypothetical protein